MLHSSSSLLFPLQPSPPLLPTPATHRRVPAPHGCPTLVTRHSGEAVAVIRSHVRDRDFHVFRPSVTPAPHQCFPSSQPGRSLKSRYPSPELGLLSLAFVISVVIVSFFTLAVISLPLMGAVRKLSMAMDRLSRVVAEEVPMTLLSLKLSGWEINELTQQLKSVRRIISGNRYHGEGDQMRKRRRSKRGGDDHITV